MVTELHSVPKNVKANPSTVMANPLELSMITNSWLQRMCHRFATIALEPQLGPKQKAEKELKSSVFNSSSPIRRHQEVGKKKRQKPTQPHGNSLTQPPSQHETGNIILYPEKIYLSIFLEPRDNNNILQEHRHKYPTILYIIS